jgi:hypothetical protein
VIEPNWSTSRSGLAAIRPDCAYSTPPLGMDAGIIEMRQYSENVACPCGETMRLSRTGSHAELPSIETFECKACGLVVTAESVSGSHALIEKHYFS